MRALRRAKQLTGLEIHALVLGEHNEEGGLADENADVAGRARDDVVDALAWAHELGADVILVPFFMRSELGSEADVDRAAAAFRSLCPIAAERGVALGYEGTLSAEEILSLAARVGSEAFRVLLRPREPAREARPRPSFGDQGARPPDPARPRQGHARDCRRLPSGKGPGRLRGVRTCALRDRIRRVAHA